MKTLNRYSIPHIDYPTAIFSCRICQKRVPGNEAFVNRDLENVERHYCTECFIDLMAASRKRRIARKFTERKLQEHLISMGEIT